MHRFAVLASLAALSACATPPSMDVGQVADPRTPTELWKVEVASQPHEIRLAVHAAGLSSTQADALAGFAADWREVEGGTITLQAPSGPGVDGSAAFRTGEGARTFLTGQGVRPDQIRIVGYDAKGEASPPLLVGYLRHQAVIPECGRSWTNISHSMANEVQPNFGCAVTANMAAQIANPADFKGPRATTAPDAARRVDVMAKYRKGENTSSQADKQATGAVSQVVK
ncbi:CpaD family pilus assembly protein [Phenylobacterium sp.]|uniref:CpaD family pilus assembly protein n=1 Tax=Phenylobacterium sp. TaxID=1871053 RepID=UPI002736D8E1|nr:CpaD family pilus assembly protein [Phenylobacterium sp.]MDP3855662.1 CpaD family pilus assembly protein [Phenylobacterium sp.]